jgi:hypothetical protein
MIEVNRPTESGEDDDASSDTLLSGIGLIAALAVAIAAALLALWLGIRDQDIGWKLTHIAGALVATIGISHLVHERRRFHPPKAQGRRIARERSEIPALAAAAAVLILPWSPAQAAITSTVVTVVFAYTVHQLLAHAAASPTRPLRLDATVRWTIRNQRLRALHGGALGIVLVILATVGVAAGSVYTGNNPQVPVEPSPPTSTTQPSAGGSTTTAPHLPPCDAIDFEFFGLAEDVAEQIDRAVGREGRAAGCVVQYRLTTTAGVAVFDTDGGYVAMAWADPDVQFGVDGAPRSALWWAGAFNAPGALDLLDLGLPGDRLSCDGGGVAPILTSTLEVIGLVASSDYDTWYVVGPELIGSYADLASQQGMLPMPVGPAVSGDLGLTQPMSETGALSVGPARTVSWSQLEMFCDPVRDENLAD